MFREAHVALRRRRLSSPRLVIRWLFVVSAAMHLSSSASTAEAFSLGTRFEYSTGSGPRSVALADLDRDGHVDMVTSEAFSNTVSVWLGEGSGVFGSRASYPTSNFPISVTIGDADGDGKLDLATANYFGDSFTVWFGDGAGSFTARVDHAAGNGPQAIAIGDFSDDGNPDVVVANYDAHTVSVVFGDGARTFGPKVDHPTGIFPYSVAIEDLNCDGHLDLAVANYGSGTISVLLGAGAGGLAPKVDYPAGAGTFSIAIGDLNDDGWFDLATSNVDAASVSVLLGDGSGTFGAKTDHATGSSPYSVAIGDLDGDGRLDLATANRSAGTVSVLAGDGAGGFGPHSEFSSGPGPESLSIANLNDDGWLDIAVANTSVNKVSALLNDGTGWLAVGSSLPVGARPQGLAVADLDSDGHPDLVTTNGFVDSLTVVVYRGDGAGEFGPGTSIPSLPGSTDPVLADLNGDGQLDLLVSPPAPLVSVYLGDGMGGFGVRTDHPTGGDMYSRTGSMAVEDVNGDGNLDLLLVTSDYVVAVFPGDGLGGFGARSDYAIAGNPDHLQVEDVDLDGWPDLIVAHSGSTGVSVLLNNGSGFDAQVNYPIGGEHKVALGHLNGDLYPDLVVMTSEPGSVSVLLGTGGGFGPATEYPSTWNGSDLGLGDVNGDGRLDVAVSSTHAQDNSSGPTSVFLGDGRGGLGTRTEYAVGSSFALVLVDTNSDGRLDIVTGDWQESRIQVLLGLIPTLTTLTVGPNPALVGTPITLTANVSIPEPGFGAPTDSVRFFAGTSLIGTAPMIAGAASLVMTEPCLLLPDLELTATYTGGGNLLGSYSDAVTLHLATSLPEFVSVVVIPLEGELNASGASWADYDDDGDLDFFVSRELATPQLLRNEGNGSFSEVPGALLAGLAGGRGALWGDYDNDGDTDLYLLDRFFGASLVRNDGGGQFVRVVDGPSVPSGSEHASWVDYDNDGDLDLFVVVWNESSQIFRNVGGGVFEGGTGSTLDITGPVIGAGWGDYDNDGDPDLYLINQDIPNQLWRNDGSGVFADVTSGPLGGAGQGRGAIWGDFDNDADLDLYLFNGYEVANQLLRNDGGGVFADVTTSPLDGLNSSSNAAWGDYDNDGHLDLCLTSFNGPSKLFRNEGSGVFSDATSIMPGLGNGYDTGVAWGDFDADGDLDLLVTNNNYDSKLLRNGVVNANHWLHVDLEGTVSNRSAIGARVRVVTGGVSRIAEISGSLVGASQNSLTAEFGLGSATAVDSVIVRWPSGRVQVLDPAPSVDQRILVVETLDNTGVDVPETDRKPTSYQLHRAFPNPFNPSTVFRFDLPESGPVQLTIYDVAGRRIRMMAQEPKLAGSHEMTWHGRDDQGRQVASGVYLVRLEAGAFVQTRQVTLLK